MATVSSNSGMAAFMKSEEELARKAAIAKRVADGAKRRAALAADRDAARAAAEAESNNEFVTRQTETRKSPEQVRQEAADRDAARAAETEKARLAEAAETEKARLVEQRRLDGQRRRNELAAQERARIQAERDSNNDVQNNDGFITRQDAFGDSKSGQDPGIDLAGQKTKEERDAEEAQKRRDAGAARRDQLAAEEKERQRIAEEAQKRRDAGAVRREQLAAEEQERQRIASLRDAAVAETGDAGIPEETKETVKGLSSESELVRDAAIQKASDIMSGTSNERLNDIELAVLTPEMRAAYEAKIDELDPPPDDEPRDFAADIEAVKNGSFVGTPEELRAEIAKIGDRVTRMRLMEQLSRAENFLLTGKESIGESGVVDDSGDDGDNVVTTSSELVSGALAAFEEGGYDSFFEYTDSLGDGLDTVASEENPTGMTAEMAAELGMSDAEISEINASFDEGGYDAMFLVVDKLNAQRKIQELWASGDTEGAGKLIDDWNREHGYLPAEDIDTDNPTVANALANLTTELTENLSTIFDELGFNPVEEKMARRALIDADILEAQERLARMNLLDPGATGEFERANIELEKQRLRSYNELTAELSQRTSELSLRTAELMTGALVQVGGLELEQDRFGESTRQFNKSLKTRVDEFARQFGLDEAQSQSVIRQINQDIINSTRGLSAQIGQAWAGITGNVGTTSGVVSAGDLGIDISSLETGGSPESILNSREGKTAASSFSAMMGRAATDEELLEILSGGEATVDSMPTLESRRFASEISMQNMERLSKYDAIAKEHGLNERQFTQAKDEADRVWNETTLDVAGAFGIEDDVFRTQKWRYDQIILAGGTEDEALSRISVGLEANAIDRGTFLRASDQFDRVYGNQQKEIAQRIGFNADQFDRANRQAEDHEGRTADIWASLLNSERSPMEFDAASPEMASLIEPMDEFLSGSFPEKEAPDPPADIDPVEIVPDGKKDGSSEAKRSKYRRGLLSGNALTLTAAEREDYARKIQRVGTSNYSIAEVADILDGLPEDDVSAIKDHISRTWAIVPDRELPEFVHSFMEMRASGKTSFSMNAIKKDWFDELDGAEQTALFAILNGAGNTTPEAKAPGLSEVIGMVVGQGIQAYAAFS